MQTKLFFENQKYIMRYNPRLAALVFNEQRDRLGFTLSKAKNGDITCFLQTSAARVFLHSKFNPTQEAENIIKRQDYSASGVWIILGLGLGYYLFALLEKIKGDDLVLIIEREPTIFRYSLSLFDWREIFQDERFDIIIGANVTIKQEFWRRMIEEEPKYLKHKPLCRIFSQYYRDVEAYINDQIKILRKELEEYREKERIFWEILEKDLYEVDKPSRLDRYTHLKGKETYREFYEAMYEAKSDSSYYENLYKGVDSQGRLPSALECAKEPCCDIGCGRGGFVVNVARRKGYKIIGVDINLLDLKEAAQKLKEESEDVQQRIRYVQAWAEELPFRDESFQSALLGEILEHVFDPKIVVKEAIRILKREGVLWISVPKVVLFTKEHVRLFTEGSLLDLLSYFSDFLDLTSLKWYPANPSLYFCLSIKKQK
jgi:2-polyprenyl-3-methyl-5-hydroxy-6-metoxy-1,4-benzoquinol methylase